MTNYTQIDLHVDLSHTNKSLDLNKCSIMQEKNGNACDSWYIPSYYTEVFRLSTKIIINYRYTSEIITLQLTS